MLSRWFDSNTVDYLWVRNPRAVASMASMQLDILYEDNHLVAVAKPAMLPTMGVASDRPSVLALVKDYIRDKYQKPGNVYLGIVSRLDAPVTGVVLMARTSKAARRLAQQFKDRLVQKVYWALVDDSPEPPVGELVHYLRKDERHRKMHATIASAAGAQEARLHYRLLKQFPDRTLLEVKPETGRKHQIRVQLAKIGCQILGDRKYGSRYAFPSGIALHAMRLVFEHPVRCEPMELVAPLPKSWRMR